MIKTEKVSGWVRGANTWHKAASREPSKGKGQLFTITAACGAKIANALTRDAKFDAAPNCTNCK